MPSKKSSAAKPAPRAKTADAPHKPAHGRRKFNVIIILDTGSQFTAAEAELRLRTMAIHHTRENGLPPIVRVSALNASPMSSAMTLYRAWRAVGHGSPALYICASSTGNNALTMLTTDWGNVVMGPNDGTFGLLARLFAERDIQYKLQPLELDSIVATERLRMDNPDWAPASDFALRDYLAPAAAMCLGGKDPTTASALPLRPETLPFADTSRTLRLKLFETQTAYALPVANTPEGAVWLLNLTLDPLSFDQLLDDKASFSLDMLDFRAPCKVLRLFRRPTVNAESTAPPLAEDFWLTNIGQTRIGSLGLDGALAPAWDERFLTLTIPHSTLNPNGGAVPLTLTRQS